MSQGVRRSKGVVFDIRSQSCEVPRASTRDTWQNHEVGPRSRPTDTRHTFGGVNTPLTSRVLGTREKRERRFEPSTREVTSSENERRKVKSRLSGFGKEGAKVGPLNSRRRERRKVLVLSLASGRARRH
jgi:hypothetical protein